MRIKITKILALVVLLAVLTYCFVINPEVLPKEFISGSGIPSGTLITWAGLLIYSFLMFGLMKRNSDSKLSQSLKNMLFLNVMLAAVWGVISYWLSGNWAFAFKNSEFYFRVWIGITLYIVVLPMIAFLILTIFRGVKYLIKR